MNFKTHLLLAAIFAPFFPIKAQSNLIAVTVHFETKIGNAVFGPDEMAGIAANFSDSVASISGTEIVLMLPAGGDFSIKPYLNENVKNGITTFDIVETRKHILGITLFSSPFQLFAADVTHDDTVTTYDLVGMSKVSIGVDTLFPFNTSWRFLAADFVFDSIKNPLKQGCPEAIEIANLQAPTTVNFIAVKIGDVQLAASTDTDGPVFRDKLEKLNLQFWPSPATGLVNFQFKLLASENVRLEVFDEKGKRVLTENRFFGAGPTVWPVDFSRLANGAYFACISTAGKRAVAKVVKG